MGLLNLFKKNQVTQQKTNIINIDASLGNVLLTGNSPYGKNRIFSNYAISIMNNGGGCIVVRNVNSGFSAVPSIYQNYQGIFGLDTSDGAFTEQINPLAQLNEQQTVELLFNLFNKNSEFEPGQKMKFKQYLAKLVYFAKMSGKTLRINELQDYTIEYLEDLNNRARIPDMEKDRNERFFDSVRSDMSVLESYFYEFANNNIGFILSGTQSIEEILNTGKVLEINLDFSTRKEESEQFLSILTDKICRFDYGRTRLNQMAIVIDEVPNDTLISSGFDKLLIATDKCHTIYSIMDIATLAEKSNVFIDKADSLFFFQQNSNKNKEYCSQFFGTYERQKVSTTETSSSSSGKNRSSTWDYLRGQGSTSYSDQYSSGTSYTTTTEKTNVYESNVFGSLNNNQCIFFFRSNHSHDFLTIQ